MEIKINMNQTDFDDVIKLLEKIDEEYCYCRDNEIINLSINITQTKRNMDCEIVFNKELKNE